MTPPLRALIVDDEPLAIERLPILLEPCEAVVGAGAANSGQRALELLKELRPDACLLDIGVPRTDGIELTRALGTTASPARIVFVIAYDRLAVAAFEVDAVDDMEKPIDPARLTRALAWIREHHPAQSQIAEPATCADEFWAGDDHGMTRLRAADIIRRSFIAGLRRDDNGWIAKFADGGEQRVVRL